MPAKPPARKPGRPRSTDAETIRLQVRLPAPLVAEIEDAAAADDRSRDAWIRRAIEAALRPR